MRNLPKIFLRTFENVAPGDHSFTHVRLWQQDGHRENMKAATDGD